MIRLQNLTLQRGSKILLNQSQLTLNPQERVGLIGINGAGKSSLFALLRGQFPPDAGDIHIPPTWQIAHVAQETPATEQTALDYVLAGDTVLQQTQAAIMVAEQSNDGETLAKLHAQYQDVGGYTAKMRAESLLHGLGFKPNETERCVSDFSGGWRMRLNLAQALMCPSDLLLLDEPTNHLDLDAIIWLEDWLLRYQGTLIIISHDREFLDSVCNVIVHIDQQALKRYGGNYSQFEVQRAQQQNLQQSAFVKQQKQIEHLQSFITRFKAKATKAKQAQSRIKQLERMEQLAPIRLDSSFEFEFLSSDAAPNPLLEMAQVDCGYETNKAILKRVTLTIQNGQRIGLLGANGQGKSTLIKTIAGEIAPQSGEMHLGKGLKIGYFAQHQLETLRPQDTPLEHLNRLAPNEREQVLRDFLGRFNFPGAMATSPIEPLSGGEKARLALALIVWQRPNLLLLDEPTNHLDLQTREALTLALAQYEGTIILVSHDRHLLRATCDQFLLVANQCVTEFDGDLDDYRVWLQAHQKAQREVAKGEANTSTIRNESAHSAPSNKEDAQTQYRLNQLRKPILKKLEKIEAELTQLNSQKTQIETALADEKIYLDENKKQLNELLSQQSLNMAQIQAVETHWLMLQEELESIL